MILSNCWCCYCAVLFSYFENSLLMTGHIVIVDFPNDVFCSAHYFSNRFALSWRTLKFRTFNGASKEKKSGAVRHTWKKLRIEEKMKWEINIVLELYTFSVRWYCRLMIWVFQVKFNYCGQFMIGISSDDWIHRLQNTRITCEAVQIGIQILAIWFVWKSQHCVCAPLSLSIVSFSMYTNEYHQKWVNSVSMYDNEALRELLQRRRQKLTANSEVITKIRMTHQSILR